MAPYSFTAAILLVIVISVVFGSKPVGDLGDLETGVLAPERSKHQPDEIRITGYGAGYGGWRTVIYSLLFIVCLLAVSGTIRYGPVRDCGRTRSCSPTAACSNMWTGDCR